MTRGNSARRKAMRATADRTSPNSNAHSDLSEQSQLQGHVSQSSAPQSAASQASDVEHPDHQALAERLLVELAESQQEVARLKALNAPATPFPATRLFPSAATTILSPAASTQWQSSPSGTGLHTLRSTTTGEDVPIFNSADLQDPILLRAKRDRVREFLLRHPGSGLCDFATKRAVFTQLDPAFDTLLMAGFGRSAQGTLLPYPDYWQAIEDKLSSIVPHSSNPTRATLLATATTLINLFLSNRAEYPRRPELAPYNLNALRNALAADALLGQHLAQPSGAHNPLDTDIFNIVAARFPPFWLTAFRSPLPSGATRTESLLQLQTWITDVPAKMTPEIYMTWELSLSQAQLDTELTEDKEVESAQLTLLDPLLQPILNKHE